MARYGKYRHLLIAAVLLLVLAAAGCSIGSGAVEELLPVSTLVPFTDESQGFSLSYPQEWLRMPDEDLGAAITGFSAPETTYGHNTNITVLHMELPSEMTVDAFFDASKSDLESSAEYTPVSVEELYINDTPSIKYRYEYDSEGLSLTGVRLFQTEGKSGWIVTCISSPEYFDSLEPAFNNVVDSFRLVENESPVISYFTVSPDTISTGQPATLSWAVSGATSVSINPGNESLAPIGTLQISPSATTTYTLTAAAGTEISTGTVNVLVMGSDDALVSYDPVTGRNADIGFRWEQLCLASQYQVQIAKDEGFSLIVFDSGVYEPALSTSPAMLYQAGGRLEAGHTYYWRARVRQAITGQAIHGPWSLPQKFTVSAGLPVSTSYYGLRPLSPGNNCTGCSVKSPAFSWSGLNETTKYRFTLARNADLTDVIIIAETSGTAYTYTGTLDYNTSYFWQVMAIEPALSEPSATFIFITEPEPEVEPVPEIPLPEEPATPLWVWVIIGIGSALIVVVLVFIMQVH